jgi:hypothetical protein
MLSTAEDARVDFATTTSSTTYEYGLQTTIACSSSNTPVKIPECNPGAGAPRAEEWLASQQRGEGLIKLEGSADGAFFLANMLPTFLASFFSIPWKIMELQAATLEPFRQVTRGSMALRSILGNYQEFHALKAPLPLLTTCLVYGSAAITALSSEGWQLELVGTCGEFDNEGCVPIMQVVPKVVRALQIMLAIVALLAFVLAFYSRRTRLDVYADPRSILGIATLTQSPDVRNIFRNLEPTASIETLKSRIGHTRLKLGTDPTTRGHGFQLSEPPQLYSDKEESPAHMSQRPMARLMLLLSLFILFLAALTIVTIYYIVTSNEDGFERFMSGQGFGPRFIFAICGVIVNLGWVSIFQRTSYAPSLTLLPLLPLTTNPTSHYPPPSLLRDAAARIPSAVYPPALLLRPLLFSSFWHPYEQPAPGNHCPLCRFERISSAATRQRAIRPHNHLERAHSV